MGNTSSVTVVCCGQTGNEEVIYGFAENKMTDLKWADDQPSPNASPQKKRKKALKNFLDFFE